MLGKRLKRRLRRMAAPLLDPVQALADLVLAESTHRRMREHPNPLNRHGRKVYSQTDEDGITFEIVRRMGVERGLFAEFGVGNGLENNTLALAALGWRGFWVGNEALAFQAPREQHAFAYLREWVTRDNIAPLAERGLALVGGGGIDVLSLDLDGNDIYLADALLGSGQRPGVCIVEYNAKFPPPIRWQIDYDPAHRWAEDDYFGASLSSFDDLFRDHGYFLAACNGHTGANAFFVQNRYREAFTDVPTDIGLLYSEPRYYLYRGYGFRTSPRTAEVILRRNSES
jgi:hypothetical protein